MDNNIISDKLFAELFLLFSGLFYGSILYAYFNTICLLYMLTLQFILFAAYISCQNIIFKQVMVYVFGVSLGYSIDYYFHS